jgi:hypothetical protein
MFGWPLDWSQSPLLLRLSRGWLWVAATALLLYGLSGSLMVRFMLSPQTADSSSTGAVSMVAKPSFWRGAGTPLVIFLVLAAVVEGLGYAIYAHQQGALQEAKGDELVTIADRKAAEISHWLEERRNDAEFIAEEPFLSRAAQRWFSAGAPEDGERLARWLTAVKNTLGYSAVILLDARAQIRW